MSYFWPMVIIGASLFIVLVFCVERGAMMANNQADQITAAMEMLDKNPTAAGKWVDKVKHRSK
jgi:hypothetical protein